MNAINESFKYDDAFEDAQQEEEVEELDSKDENQ